MIIHAEMRDEKRDIGQERGRRMKKIASSLSHHENILVATLLTTFIFLLLYFSISHKMPTDWSAWPRLSLPPHTHPERERA